MPVERSVPSLVLSGHRDAVWQCAFSPDGTRIASASRDNTVNLWDATTGGLQRTLSAHRNWVRTCTFSPDSRLLVSGSRDRTLKVWEVESGAELATLKGHWDEVTRAQFCLDGARIVSGSLDGSVRLWDAETGQQLEVLTESPTRVGPLTCSPDGSRVAAARDQAITVWDATSGRRLGGYLHQDLVRSCAFSPDGRQVLSGAGRGALKLWEADSGTELASFQGHANYVSSCAFSPDGMRAVSTSSDRTIRIWDLESRSCLSILSGHNAEVWTCTFSPDGKFLVSASEDKTLRWWNALTGAALGALSGHTDEIHACAFSPDGTRIVSASHDATLRLWMLQPRLDERRERTGAVPGARHPKTRLFAFISYRRENGAETARLIRRELEDRGFKTFLDVEDLGASHFDERLFQRIEEATHFILVLSPGALDRCRNADDWLRREIQHAFSTKRNIVPVLKEGFQFPEREILPDELADLPRHNCVEYSHIYFQATIGRVLAFCGVGS